MQRYFAINKSLELDKGDYHHIKNVMRMKVGDLINIVFDNLVYTCKLTKINKEVSFEVIKTEEKNANDFQITVAFSLIKEQHLNYLLQKATEVGADFFIPLNTKRSVVKIEPKKETSKMERWKKICKEASEQSHRFKMPEIYGIKNLKELVTYDYDLKLLCSLNENTKNIKKVLQKSNKCVKILIVVGPEGGFDAFEEQFLIENGFQSISLGENVMRAETAPVSAISMINYEFMR